MKCLGRTQNEFKRCSNKGQLKYLGFCHKHKIQSIVILVSVLGFIGTITGIYQDLLFPIIDNKNLEIVDIRIVQSDTLPSLDIKLQNNTNDPVFIYEIESTTLKSWEFEPPDVKYSFTPISHKYELFLNKKEDNISKLKTSQSLKPKDTDRFQIVLGGNSFNPSGLHLILFKLKVKFSKDKSITTNKILVNIPTYGTINGAYHGPPDLDVIQHNYEASKEILKQIDQKSVVDNDILETMKELSKMDSTQFKKKYMLDN